jgi:hypothetical protein
MKTALKPILLAVTALLLMVAPKTASAECLEWGEFTNGKWQYWPVTIDSIDGNTFHFHWGGTNINDKGVVIAKLKVDTDRGVEAGETVFKGRWSNDATGRWGKIRLFLKNGKKTARGYISFKNEGTENKALLRECGAGKAGPQADCLEWGEYTNNGWQYWPVTVDSISGNTFHFHWGGTNINDKGVVIAKLTMDRDSQAETGETVFKGRWSNDATGRWGKIRLFLKQDKRTARGFISFKNEGTENKALLRACRN